MLYIVPKFLQGMIFALVLRNNLMVFYRTEDNTLADLPVDHRRVS